MNIRGKNRSGSASNECPAPLPEVYETAWYHLLRSGAELAAYVEQSLKEDADGLTLAEFDILNVLIGVKDGGRLSISQLTAFTRLSRSAASRLLDKMEATNGYVRKRAKDGKTVWAEITLEGRAAMKATLRPAWEQAVRNHFANSITESDARILRDILLRFRFEVRKK